MPLDGQNYRASEVKAPPKIDATLDGLIAWLETKDPRCAYNYGDIYNCLFCQFVAEVNGVKVCALGGREYGHRESGESLFFAGAWEMEIANSEYHGGNTFGSALRRARALQARS